MKDRSSTVGSTRLWNSLGLETQVLKGFVGAESPWVDRQGTRVRPDWAAVSDRPWSRGSDRLTLPNSRARGEDRNGGSYLFFRETIYPRGSVRGHRPVSPGRHLEGTVGDLEVLPDNQGTSLTSRRAVAFHK